MAKTIKDSQRQLKTAKARLVFPDADSPLLIMLLTFPPITTPIDTVIMAGEGPIIPINAPVTTSGNSHSIASTSASGTTKGLQVLDSTEADHSVTQAPPLKRKLRD